MRNSPLVTAFLILIVLCAVFFVLVFAISYFGDQFAYGLGGDKIGIVKIEGTILESESIIEKIVKFRKNDSVKAIILRINSPGGVVVPPQEIHREVKKACKEKTVVVSVESIAASGGYYIACAAESIVANPGTLVGSIGVLLPLENIEELLKKIGLQTTVIKSGKYKDIGSITRPITKEEEAILQDLIDNTYNQFVDVVAEGRGMKREEVLTVADGRVFTGAQAIELGLVDKLGNLEDTITLAAQMAGIEGEPKVIYPKKKKLSVLDFFFEEVAQALSRLIEKTLSEKLSLQYLPFPR